MNGEVTWKAEIQREPKKNRFATVIRQNLGCTIKDSIDKQYQYITAVNTKKRF